MLCSKSHETFAEAYVSGLHAILNRGGVVDPLSPGSGFGAGPRPTRELVAYAFEVREPKSISLLLDRAPDPSPILSRSVPLDRGRIG
jgi:hypothetical protein